MTAQTLISHALELERVMYLQGIDPVCPIGLTGTADRWHGKRQELAQARIAAEQAIDEGVDYFAVCGARDGSNLKAEARHA